MNIPKGAMYIMLKINFDLLFDISDDAEFAQKLLMEENLSVLPGLCFRMGGYSAHEMPRGTDDRLTPGRG